MRVLIINKFLYSAYHVRVTNVDELQSILNSKYILSHIGTTYQQIKEDLKNGKLVLFGGTPCQALGLKSFLNNEYENLIVVDNEKYKGTYVGAKFIMPVPCKHRVLRAPLEQQVRIEDSHAAIMTPEEFAQAQKVIMLQHGNHQAGNYTKRQYPLKGKVYCGYCRKLMKYRVLKKLGPSFNCRFSATAVDSPCKRIPISEKMLEEIVRNALTVQIKQAEHMLEILHERERKALIFFSALERQEEKLSAEKAELVKLRVALYEQYADGNMSKEEFIRQRDAYRVQEDERMEQIQRLRTEKDQIFQPVKKDTDNLQAMMNTVGEAGDVMHLSQNVVEAFIDRIEVFNDERVKIHFTFEDVLADHAE